MLKFEPVAHTYTTDTRQYQSVTSFIKTFEQDKDWDLIAERYVSKGREEVFKKLSAKEGNPVSYYEELFDGIEITAEVIKNHWKLRGEIAATGGTMVHEYFESLDVNNSPLIHTQKIVDGHKIALDLKTLQPGIYPELILYLHRYGLAGQTDRVTIDEEGFFEIEDYKTNGSIDFEATSFFNPRRKRKEKNYLKPPLSRLEECNWNIYQLQLSMYAYMLETYGFKCKKLSINHVIMDRNPDNSFKIDSITGRPAIKDVIYYEAEYLKSDIQSILKTLEF